MPSSQPTSSPQDIPQPETTEPRVCAWTVPDSVAATASRLRDHGFGLWLVGAGARAVVTGRVLPLQLELVSDAPAELCVSSVEPTETATHETATHETTPHTTMDLKSIAGVELNCALGARGITVDAFAISINGELHDPQGGVRHLEGKVIRTVMSPDVAFRRHPILLVRVAHMIAATGAQASAEVLRYATRDAGNVLDVENRNQAWGREINALLLSDHVEPALQWLQDTRVLPFIMPEIAAMVGFDRSCSVHHKDIWDHTKQVTQKAARNLVVRWAALCHDIGKVWTRSVNRQGKVHFFRHEGHGALLFESIAHRMALDEVMTARISYLIENHSRVNLYLDDWTDSAVRRLVRDTEGHLDDLLTFSKADFTTKRQSKIDEMRRQMGNLEARIAEIKAIDAKQPALLKGVGGAIMTHFSLRPSRAIGDLKRLLEAEVEAGNLPERSDDYPVYLEWLASNDEASAIMAAANK